MSDDHNAQQESIIVSLDDADKNAWHKDALLKTLDYLQAIITRMADNSRNCKSWAVGLVTALAAITFRADQPVILLLASFPGIVLWWLDGFYLHQERCFRKAYKTIVNDFHQNTLEQKDLLNIRPPGMGSGGPWSQFLPAVKRMFDSPSTLPFYGILAILLIALYLAIECGYINIS